MTADLDELRNLIPDEPLRASFNSNTFAYRTGLARMTKFLYLNGKKPVGYSFVFKPHNLALLTNSIAVHLKAENNTNSERNLMTYIALLAEDATMKPQRFCSMVWEFMHPKVNLATFKKDLIVKNREWN